MSRYEELRVHFGKSPAERMAMLQQEMQAPLAEARRLADALRQVEPSAAPELFGGRFDELIDILGISTEKLNEVASQGSPLLERARSVGGLADEEVHIFRHDMLTPIGTVRGVAGMLARADVSQSPNLPPDFTSRAQALADAINELKDVLDALTDTRGREGSSG